MFNNVLLAFDVDVATKSLFSQRSPTDPIPVAIQELWKLTMEGSLYVFNSSIGGALAIFAIGFYCVKIYQAFEEGTSKSIVSTLFHPLIIIMLLSNGGDNFAKLTMTTRDVINNVNSMTNQIISSEVSIRSANEVLSKNFWVSSAVNYAYKECLSSPYPEKIVSCLDGVKVQADGWVGAENKGVANTAEFQAKLDKWKKFQMDKNAEEARRAKRIATAQNTPPVDVPVDATNPSATPTTSIPPSILDRDYYANQDNLDSVVSTIMSFRKGYTYIIEIMMLVTAVIGPIPLGLSLFSPGAKPLITWGVSFLSLGFCKICYSLISGLSSIAFIYAGPENTDMTVVAVVLGLLAPALSFSIASGSGLAALNVVNQVQTGGLQIGLGGRDPK